MTDPVNDLACSLKQTTVVGPPLDCADNNSSPAGEMVILMGVVFLALCLGAIIVEGIRAFTKRRKGK